MTRPDVVIVGGGAAGLAAADRLAAAEAEVLMLEARQRLGGRAWTERAVPFPPLELGAEFLHGARVSTWELIDRTADEVVRSRRSRRRGGGPHATALVAEAPVAIPPDSPAPSSEESVTDYLGRLGIGRARHPPGTRVLEVDSEGRDAWSAIAARELGLLGPPPDRGGDYVLRSGYDRVLARLQGPSQQLFGARVRSVSRTPDGVTVDWEPGAGSETVRASAVIVTVPLGVLQAGTITFGPPLPHAVQSAIDALGMVDVAKLLYVVPQQVLPVAHTIVLDRDEHPTTIWSSGPRAGGGGDVLVVWMTGAPARELLAAGEDDALAHGLQVLRDVFDRAELTPCYQRVHDWTADPLSGGAYSYVPPGGHHARAVLERPVDDRLVFAGEATSPDASMTVHGAIDSGRRAAEQVLTGLGAPRSVVR